MNEPNEPEAEFGISIPEGFVLDEPEPEAEPPAQDPPGSATYILPEGYITAAPPESEAAPAEQAPAGEPPAEAPPADEPPPHQPPIVRHDPFAWMRGAPWMNRDLTPSGRAAAFLRRLLEDFPAIEGRQPNRADLDAIVKRTSDYMVPIFKRERATDIAYEELEKRRAARIAAATAAAHPTGSLLKGAAARLAPLAPTAAGIVAPAAAAALAFRPTSPDEGDYVFGDDLRFRVPPGSLQGEIERRIGDRWHRVAVAELNSGVGPKFLLEDARAFAASVGAQVANRLLSQGIVGERRSPASSGRSLESAIRWVDHPSALGSYAATSGRLPIAELRMLTKDKAGTRFGEITRAEAEEFCPNYPRIQVIASEAGRIARMEEQASHRQYGVKTHVEVKKAIKDAAVMRELLENHGVQEIHADLAIFGGGTVGFRNVRGSAIIDVVELMKSGAVCIYDIKTGGARFPDATMERYVEEYLKFFKAKHHRTFTGVVYVLPVYVEDMFGRDHNRK